MNRNNIDIKGIGEFFKSNNDFLILTHKSPDGDTLGSAYALCESLQLYGKRAGVICSDEIPKKFYYFTEKIINNCNTENPTVISVDIADTKLMGSLKEKYENKVMLSVDHHVTNLYFAKYNYVNAFSGANCENIYEILVNLGMPINKNIAEALYTGISTDTGCFRYSNTTSKTHLIAANLMDYGINNSEIDRIMFETKTKSKIALEKYVLDNLKFYFNGNAAIVVLEKEQTEALGCSDDDFDGISSITRCIEGVKVGITLREKENNVFKGSVRTYEPFDASDICKRLSGGGHARAAGCEITAKKEDAVKKVLNSIEIEISEKNIKI